MAEKIHVWATFDDPDKLEQALKYLKGKGVKHYEAYGPVTLKHLEENMPKQGSPVRLWSTAGALLGMMAFWYMCVAAALIYKLVVGGKHPAANVPYVVVMYEGTILLGALFAFVAGLILVRFWRIKPPESYDPRCSSDGFAVEIECDPEDEAQINQMLRYIRSGRDQ